ncbi:MAG: leucine/isoleucine/valine transport system permease protein [Frankiales bacterium]|nr:leucine/isoleucine/valine transport system permease protein [Frankiales bacterium]
MNGFTSQFWASTIDGLTVGSIYALIALGYTLVYGVLQLINFAHSEIFMIGTFAVLGFFNMVGLDGPATGGVLVLVVVGALVVGAVSSGATALALQFIAYRPLRRRGASRLAALITAIGASLVLREAIGIWRGTTRVPAPRIMEKRELLSIGTAQLRVDKVLVIVAAVIMMILLDRFVNGSRLGRGIRATSQDAETATLMGVNIDRVVSTTFLVGGAMAGVAAALYLIFYETTNYAVGFVLGIKAFTAAVLGGIGNLRGALVGGIIIGLIENYGSSITGAKWGDVIVFSILVLVLLFKPTGLLRESGGTVRA